MAITKEITFVDGVTVVPAAWLNLIQEALAGFSNVEVDAPTGTQVRVDAGPDDSVAAIYIDGELRRRETAATFTFAAEPQATYSVYATADSGDDLFALEVTSGAPVATNYRKVGEVDWSGSVITATRTTIGRLRSHFHTTDEDGGALGASAVPGIPSGTRMVFDQDVAPTGWTRDVATVDDRVIRIVTGARADGGTWTQPGHTHTNPATGSGGSHTHTQVASGAAGSHTHTQGVSGSAGDHDHTQAVSGSAGAHTHASASTDSAGGHTHTQAASGSAGSHTHTNPTTGSAGDHDHAVGDTTGFDVGGAGTTGSAGGHTHTQAASGSSGTGTTGSAGSHSHAGPGHTHTGPSHRHTGPSHTHGPGSLLQQFFSSPARTGSMTGGSFIGGAGGVLAGDHQHEMGTMGGATAAAGTGLTGFDGTDNTGTSGTDQTSTGGSHSHSGPAHTHTNPTTATGGSHSHSGPAHTHTNPTTATGGAHTHTQAATGSGGAHTHTNPTTATGGDHTHVVTAATGSGGDHTHTNPTTATGGDHTHTNPVTSNPGSHIHTNPTTDSGGSHTHTQAATGSSATAATWRPLHRDMIIAVKD